MKTQVKSFLVSCSVFAAHAAVAQSTNHAVAMIVGFSGKVEWMRPDAKFKVRELRAKDKNTVLVAGDRFRVEDANSSASIRYLHSKDVTTFGYSSGWQTVKRVPTSEQLAVQEQLGRLGHAAASRSPSADLITPLEFDTVPVEGFEVRRANAKAAEGASYRFLDDDDKLLCSVDLAASQLRAAPDSLIKAMRGAQSDEDRVELTVVKGDSRFKFVLLKSSEEAEMREAVAELPAELEPVERALEMARICNSYGCRSLARDALVLAAHCPNAPKEVQDEAVAWCEATGDEDDEAQIKLLPLRR